jgi:hypothetical protein
MIDISTILPLQETIEVEQLDQVTLDLKLSALRAIDLKNVSVIVYVVEINKVNKLLRCKEAKLLECDDLLLSRFKGYIESCISYYAHISNFTDISTNQDNRVFHVDIDETDFPQILETLHPSDKKEDIGSVSSLDELKKFNAYIIEIHRGIALPPLYGFRYISQSWSPKNSSGGFFKFDEDMVAIFDESPIFRIDPYFDFVVLGDDAFVMDSAKFEMALQYKDRLLDRKNEAMTEMTASKIFVPDGELLFASVIGTDKHFLRQLSSVQQKGFYKDPVWVRKLQNEAAAAGNWLLEFDSKGKIIVKEEKSYVRELLTVLQNKRVQTVVDKNVFDVDGELLVQVTR